MEYGPCKEHIFNYREREGKVKQVPTTYVHLLLSRTGIRGWAETVKDSVKIPTFCSQLAEAIVQEFRAIILPAPDKA